MPVTVICSTAAVIVVPYDVTVRAAPGVVGGRKTWTAALDSCPYHSEKCPGRTPTIGA